MDELLWFDWVSTRVSAVGGILVYDETAPDWGKPLFVLLPSSDELDYHGWSAATVRERWTLLGTYEMHSITPEQIKGLKVMTRSLALTLESAQDTPAGLEAIKVLGITYQAISEPTTGLVVQIDLEVITERNA